ncbi:MAG TPA: FtsX-like permease family protein [Thermoanaerobaculia bacterium]|nr:FtsX-like permease family protein [Thermoanaerobaculia bacterium]
MIAPRWRKVFRDIADTPLRTALAVTAMAAGAFGVTMILTSYSVLKRELKTTYSDTRPASAILVLDGGVSDALVDSVRHMPGVRDAESRPVIGGRLFIGKGQWVPLILYVVRDFGDIRLDRFTSDTGAWPPGDGEVLIECSSLSVARAAVGDRVIVRTSDRVERPLRIAGTVHAAGLAPGWMEHAVAGFVKVNPQMTQMNTDKHLPLSASSADQLRLLVAGDTLDEKHIRDVANRVARSIGHVTRIDVPTPGRHPHAAQMDTFLYLLGAFGALTFALSAVLVATMIHALLTEQLRQVGVMKTIGASTRQIASLYLGQVAILAAAAIAIGVPLGIAAGQAYARFAASMLNATITRAMPALWIVVSEVVAGIAIPLLVALGPVAHAARISIHEAFSNDIGGKPFGTRRFDRWLARIHWLPRPLMLSLRTTFHRRGRLILTVATLAAGGAAFIAAMNVSAAWTRTLDADGRARRFDVQAVFSRPYPAAQVMQALASVPDVAHAECWTEAGAMVGESSVSLVGPDLNSKLLALPLIAGRWLRPDDDAVAVINQSVSSLDPTLRLGGDIPIQVNAHVARLRIVGIVKELAPHATVYMPPRTILRVTGKPPGLARSVRIVTRQLDVAGHVAASKAIEQALESAGISVAGIQSLSDSRQSFSDHLVIIKSALIFAALLVVLVGGLGLTSTLTLNVFERTREIGILSAIGATPGTIARDVVFEGMVMAVLSWCAALIVSIPITFALDAATGQMFIRSALDFYMSPLAAAVWLLLVLILAALSSFYPARRSARLAVREAIAYE